MEAFVEGRNDRSHAACHHPRRLFEDGDRNAALGRNRGKLEADIASADDHQAPSRLEMVADRLHVGDGAQVHHAFEVRAGQRQGAGAATSGDDECRVSKGGTGVCADRAGLPIDAGDAGVEHQRRSGLVVECRRFHEQPVELDLSSEKLLRQGRALIGRMRLITDDRHAAGKPLLGQAGDELTRSLSCADDDKGIDRQKGSRLGCWNDRRTLGLQGGPRHKNRTDVSYFVDSGIGWRLVVCRASPNRTERRHGFRIAG